MSLEGATLIKYNLLNKRILESAFLVSTEIKNTALFDSLEAYSERLGFRTIEKNYDSFVMIENSSFVFERLLWRTVKMKAGHLTSTMGSALRLQVTHQEAQSQLQSFFTRRDDGYDRESARYSA